MLKRVLTFSKHGALLQETVEYRGKKGERKEVRRRIFIRFNKKKSRNITYEMHDFQTARRPVVGTSPRRRGGNSIFVAKIKTVAVYTPMTNTFVFSSHLDKSTAQGQSFDFEGVDEVSLFSLVALVN